MLKRKKQPARGEGWKKRAFGTKEAWRVVFGLQRFQRMPIKSAQARGPGGRGAISLQQITEDHMILKVALLAERFSQKSLNSSNCTHLLMSPLQFGNITTSYCPRCVSHHTVAGETRCVVQYRHTVMRSTIHVYSTLSESPVYTCTIHNVILTGSVSSETRLQTPWYIHISDPCLKFCSLPYQFLGLKVGALCKLTHVEYDTKQYRSMMQDEKILSPFKKTAMSCRSLLVAHGSFGYRIHESFTHKRHSLSKDRRVLETFVCPSHW